MQDESPYAPPKSTDRETADDPTSASGRFVQWLLRITMMFVGSLMIGMSLTLVLVTGSGAVSLLPLAVIVVGFLLVLAGIRNKPPNLSFIPIPVPKRKKGKGFECNDHSGKGLFNLVPTTH